MANQEARKKEKHHFWSFVVCVIVVVTLFSNIIHEQNTYNTILNNNAYPGYCNMYYVEGHQKKP